MILDQKKEILKLNAPIGEPNVNYSEDNYYIQRCVDQYGIIIWYGINTNWKLETGSNQWMKLEKSEFIPCDTPVYELLYQNKIIKNDWNVAKKNKPESGKLVIVYTPEKTILESNILLGIYWDDTDDWTVYDFQRSKELIVTHWKEIPNAPY